MDRMPCRELIYIYIYIYICVFFNMNFVFQPKPCVDSPLENWFQGNMIESIAVTSTLAK